MYVSTHKVSKFWRFSSLFRKISRFGRRDLNFKGWSSWSHLKDIPIFSKIFWCSQRYSDLLKDILMLSKIFRRYLKDILMLSKIFRRYLEDIPKISRRYSLTITCIQDKSQKLRSLHLTHLTFLFHCDQCPLMRSSTLTQRDRATSSHSMFSQLFSY